MSMKPPIVLLLLALTFLMVACRAAPEVRNRVEPSDTAPVVYDYRNLKFRARNEMIGTGAFGQRFLVEVTVTNPDRRRVVLTTTMSCALRFAAISEKNPEVRIREPDRGCPDYAVNTVIPPETTVTPQALGGTTATGHLLPDSAPEGLYRLEPELILLGPFEWGHPPVHVPIDAGRVNLKRAP
jgi:hypothetical protein